MIFHHRVLYKWGKLEEERGECAKRNSNRLILNVVKTEGNKRDKSNGVVAKVILILLKLLVICFSFHTKVCLWVYLGCLLRLIRYIPQISILLHKKAYGEGMLKALPKKNESLDLSREKLAWDLLWMTIKQYFQFITLGFSDLIFYSKQYACNLSYNNSLYQKLIPVYVSLPRFIFFFSIPVCRQTKIYVTPRDATEELAHLWSLKCLFFILRFLKKVNQPFNKVV